MTLQNNLTITAAKVIAAGDLGHGSLRATIILTPPTGGKDNEDAKKNEEHAKKLARWPTDVIRWLKQNQWKLKLEASPAPPGGGDQCPSSQDKGSFEITATASAMQMAWSSQANTSWLDERWAQAFQISKGGTKSWKMLRQALSQATSQDDTLKLSQDGKAPKVSAVLQTDLSLFLECNRSLELCDSIAVAGLKTRAERVERRKQEINYFLGAQPPNDVSPTLPAPVAASCANGQSAVGLAERDSLAKKMRDPINSCQQANRPEDPVVVGSKQAELDCLGQFFYSLQSSATLSRLFGLTIDVSIQASELHDIGNAAFLYLSVGPAAFDPSHPPIPIFTLTEYRPDTPAYFWPATRDESRNSSPDLKSINTLRQYHGVSVNNHRFELSCLDVRRATESVIDREAILDSQNDSQPDPSKQRPRMTDEQLLKWVKDELCTSTQETDPICKLSDDEHRKMAEDRLCKLTDADLDKLISQSPQRPAAFARKTYHTAGFTILDRCRKEQAITQYSARKASQNQKCITLDAADLLTGYRIDVGMPSLAKQQANCIENDPGSDAFTWRGLMARKVVYGVTGSHSDQIKRIVPHLFLEAVGKVNPDSGWQKCLEDGYLGLTARLIQENSTPEAYVEEAVFTWTGEPMGVLMPGQRADKVKPDPTCCGRVFIAPNKQTDADRRIPFLRFGCHYRFALRSVYPGGISLPLEAATRLYNDKDLRGALAAPASAASQPAMQLRRFLRHERIDAPLLLLPEDAALRRHGPMGYESAPRLIIRSVSGKVHDRQQPTSAQRVFIAPGVAHSLAGMHRVFDKIAVKHPPEGLSSSRFGSSGVRRDLESGGFPVVTSDHITGINGFPYASTRRITDSSVRDGADHGDLVYCFGSHAKPKNQKPNYVPYYPDPAVRYFVIGVRFAGTDIYLPGDPCVIEALGNGYNYPDTRPLVVTVQRTPAARPRSHFPRLNEVVTLPGRNGRVTHLPTGSSHIPGAVEALLTLAPGDDFELDVWCIPDFESLARQFALIESLAALALYKGNGQSQQSEPSSSELYSGLCDLLPEKSPFFECVRSYLQQPGITTKMPVDWQQTGTGPGGLTVPGPIVRKALAYAAVEVLKKHPLDEIAAVRTLRATHATDQPLLPPRLVDAPKTATGQCRPVGINRIPGSGKNRYPFQPQGMIEFDRATTSSLEISVDMASPSSDQMDNVQRGRAIRDRRFGRWPYKDGAAFKPVEVYGFEVAPDGEVTLPETCGVTLYRLDDIPLPVSENHEPAEVPRSLLLDDLFAIGDRKQDLGTGKFTFQFSDGLARHLNLRVTAFSRHRDQMRSADPIAHNGKWLHQGEPLAAADASLASACIPVWLNACVRPAEPAAQTPIPTFRWSDEVASAKSAKRSKKRAPIVHGTSRTVIVRIPIARPWFSSGEDERLGIVLWPPDFFSQGPDMFQNDQIWFKGSCKDENDNATPGRMMKLSDFQDEDLGPGGKFITRWGGDPTRFPAERIASSASSSSSGRTLMPASAFLDLSQDSGTGFVPEQVPRVSMPIRVEESTGKPENEINGDIPTLDVSLLTYRPKFDISEEQWYVDVPLAHPREAEPFVRLGLVRYQPHAPEGLRVSYPVVQWTQLLPRRTVEVRRSGLAVTIHVEGLATSPHNSLIERSFKASHELPLSSDEKERFLTAPMTARIIREANLPIGVATRSTEVFHAPGLPAATELVFSEKNTCYTSLNEGIYQAVWEETLTLDKMDLKHASYYVVVEERDLRLPATYASEPVSPQQAIGNGCNDQFDDSLLVKSGARFLAKIPL